MHVHFFVNDLAKGEGLPFADKISAAEFFRGETDDCGNAVEMTFESEDALRSAEAAESAVGRRVGGDGAAADADIGTFVRAGGMNGATGENDGGKSFVGAAVEREVDIHGEEFAFTGEGGAMAGARRMTLGGGGHVFRAIVNYFYGFTGFPGEKSGVAGEHGGIFFLAAEAAAGFGLHDADALFGEAEKADERFVNVVGTLERAPNGDAIGGIGAGDDALRLDVELLLRAGFVIAIDDEICGAPGGVHVSLFYLIGFENIVFAPDDLFLGERVIDGVDGGERLDFDLNGLAGPFEKIFVGMSEEDYGFFGMVDLLSGEAGLVFD